jgi:excinuclease UvrABC ATPase subunit
MKSEGRSGESPTFATCRAIRIRGARQNNLANIDVDIPRDAFVVVTGVSGSGKSSLVIDTIVAEGQRQFLDSLRVDARMSLPPIGPTAVDSVEGLSPTIVINQRPLGQNPRSTVGTVTEAYTFLRLLFSRLGGAALNSSDFSFNNPEGACERCHGLGDELLPDPDRLLDWDLSLSQGAIRHRTWKIGSRYLNIIAATGYFDMSKPLGQFTKSELNRLLYSEAERQENSSVGYVQSFAFEGVVRRLEHRISDQRGQQGRAYDMTFFASAPCSVCGGSRLNARARAVKIHGISLGEVAMMEIGRLKQFLNSIDDPIAASVRTFVMRIVDDLISLQLGYLSLSRSVATLSGGEAQRVRLARHLGSGLIEMVYVFDEPTTGLHSRDVAGLLHQMRNLVSRPNTVIIVEHSLEVIAAADHVIELGPGGGSQGGHLVAACTPRELERSDTETGRAMAMRRVGFALPPRRRTPTEWFEVKRARLHNLRNLTVRIPKNVLVCLTGVSGAGKSSLVHEFLQQHPQTVLVDQSAPGSSPRSNALTYIGVFDAVRALYATEAKMSPAMFTFNGQGACKVCHGLGVVEMDMHFLGTFERTCEECHGSRYDSAVLKFRFKGLTVAELLDLTVSQGVAVLTGTAAESGLRLLDRVGLGYLRLGQPLSTMSGGEAQRLKLASRLGRSSQTYILDEPTRGLHPSDVDRLRAVIEELVSGRNTVIVVEHDLDFIASADWVIDLGPEAGEGGGRVVVEGTPEIVAECAASHTGLALRHLVIART